MPNNGHFWTDKELSALKEAWKKKPDWITKEQFCETYGKSAGLSAPTINSKIRQMLLSGKLEKQYVKQSPYPVYDSPLIMTGDALVLPDMEMPFHNADFINRCLELAEAWGIKQCILAGDTLHFDSLTGWDPSWANENNGGMTADAEARLMDFAKTLSPKKQGELFGVIGEIGERKENDGLSTELHVARRELKALDSVFDRVDMILGNHCGRLLRALEVTLSPKELLRLLETGKKWRIAEYYFMHLETVTGTFTIEHPKNASKFSASRLCSKYKTHVLMAHSHQLNFTFDTSGTYYAVEMGCCVDENRLPYCAQRHNVSPMHSLGAVIVKDGYPHLLHPEIPWTRYKKMV